MLVHEVNSDANGITHRHHSHVAHAIALLLHTTPSVCITKDPQRDTTVSYISSADPDPTTLVASVRLHEWRQIRRQWATGDPCNESLRFTNGKRADMPAARTTWKIQAGLLLCRVHTQVCIVRSV